VVIETTANLMDTTGKWLVRNGIIAPHPPDKLIPGYDLAIGCGQTHEHVYGLRL
jgi:hypothetical protein